jgi:hypothetical protein
MPIPFSIQINNAKSVLPSCIVQPLRHRHFDLCKLDDANNIYTGRRTNQDYKRVTKQRYYF